MTKQEVLEALEKAKASHEAQMGKIETLLNGAEVDAPTPVTKTDCAFGKWFYDKNNHLEEILGTQFYSKLDTYHEQWHREYIKIYNIFFKDQKKGLLSTLLGKNKVDPLLIDKAKMYFTELQPITKELIHTLEASYRRVNAMSEEKIAHFS
ncbi:Methyl-accepting chemotaxis protein [hydrothermal vent metagenome]|uniref:Methyl-accepting chemotaxis protein n=1 Tax=hydrothermal vent metagenome TaxID=652676 RepID=A0A1W1D1Y6_9ZZZZ